VFHLKQLKDLNFVWGKTASGKTEQKHFGTTSLGRRARKDLGTKSVIRGARRGGEADRAS